MSVFEEECNVVSTMFESGGAGSIACIVVDAIESDRY